jgi:hypothetical protein
VLIFAVLSCALKRELIWRVMTAKKILSVSLLRQAIERIPR